MKKILCAFILVLACVSFAHGEEKRFSIPVTVSPQKGPSDAPVTIIEFIDFQ